MRNVLGWFGSVITINTAEQCQLKHLETSGNCEPLLSQCSLVILTTNVRKSISKVIVAVIKECLQISLLRLRVFKRIN